MEGATWIPDWLIWLLIIMFGLAIFVKARIDTEAESKREFEFRGTAEGGRRVGDYHEAPK